MSRRNNDLKLLLHPYVFVLKEGREISHDFLDYSLLMLQVTCPEKIKSPQSISILPPHPLPADLDSPKTKRKNSQVVN